MVSSIEAPFAFLKEQEKAVPGDAVEPSQMALGLVPEVLNPIDMVVPVGKTLRMIDANMMKIRNIQGIVARKPISVDDAVRENHPFHDRKQGISAGIGNHHRKDPTSTLQQPENWNLSCATTSTFAFPGAPEIALVNFHFASERGCLFHFIGYDFPQTSKERRCGVAMHVNDLRCCTGRCPGNKVLNEPCPFLGAESALSSIHGVTLASASVLS